MTRSLPPINRFFISPDFSVYYRRAKHLHWQNHATAGYSLLTVLNGNLEYEIDNNRHELTRFQSVVFEPNVSVAATGNQAELLFLTFSASLVMQHATSMRLIPPKSTVTFGQDQLNTDQRLNALLAELAVEIAADKPGKEIVMRALVEQVLVHILRNYSQPRLSDQLELSRVGLVDRRIRRSIELMHTQLDQDLTLHTLAAASYLSPFHFARLFKKLTGSTPHNYLAGIRAGRAQMLLAGTEMSVTEVGAQVGYLSASHFTKAFRLATGTTPREFRKGLISSNDNDVARRRQ